MRYLQRAILSAILGLSLLLGSTLPVWADVATFAGGCFWCMESPYDKLEGVSATVSGFMGGTVANPSYRQVSAGNTGHIEVVQVSYDPAQVSYETLLEVFWRNVDPLDGGGQFCDRGSQYRTAVFTHTPEQAELAVASKTQVGNQLAQSIATEVIPASEFYAAEDYHQDYYINNPVRYEFYRFACGRDRRLAELWGDS